MKEENTFSNVQLEAVAQLAKVLDECKVLGIAISGLSEYEVKELQDDKGNSYILIC